MKFFGELLILVLLFITNLRVFFLKSAKRDPLVALAPVTFILSIFLVWAWGLDISTIVCLLLSFLVLICNIHGILRYSERLFVDHYSVLMTIWAVLTSILSLGAIVCLFIFTAPGVNCKKLGVVEEKTNYTGTFSGEFEEAGAFKKVSAVLNHFYFDYEDEKTGKANVTDDKKSDVKEVEKPADKNIVLFVPDKRGDTAGYKPYLQLLAAEGYNVYSGDFYSNEVKWFAKFYDLRFCRRFSMVMHSLIDPTLFASKKDSFTYNISLECEALLNMLKEKYGDDCKIFVISDGMAKVAVSDFEKKHPENITGTFFLDFLPEYKSAGYGCIAQTNLPLNTKFGLPRENKMETPKMLVEKSKNFIEFE